MVPERLLRTALTCLSLTITAVIRVTALLLSRWASYSTPDSLIVMSLTECSTCPKATDHWGWDCFKGDFCDIKNDHSACQAFTDGYTASFCVSPKQYMALECVSLLLFLLTVQRVLNIALSKDFGAAYSAYVLLVSGLVLHLAAVVSWGAVSKAAWGACEDGLCVEDGFKVAIAGAVFDVVSFALVFWFYLTRKDQRDMWTRSYLKVCRVSVLWWATLSLLFQILTYALILWSLASSSWVKRSIVDEEWSGGLLKCHDCPFQSQRVGWDCFAGQVCNQDVKQTSTCLMYANLRDAGRTVSSTQFFAMEMCVLVILIMWTEVTLHTMVRRGVGESWVNYAYPYVALALQIAGACIWFLKSHVSISTECQIEDSNKVFLCRKDGPAIIVGSIAALACSAVLFTIAYYNRGEYDNIYTQPPTSGDLEMRKNRA